MKQEGVIFGIRAVIEAIKAGREFEKVLMQVGLQGELIKELNDEIRNAKINVQHVPVERIDRVTRKNHQGVVAFVSLIEYSNLDEMLQRVFEEGRDPKLLILDHITDVGNFGAIARSAECAGIDAIVIPDKGAAPVNADAIKTSAGALNRIAVCKSRNLYKAVEYARQSGLRVIAVTEKGAKTYSDVKLTGPIAYIMGAEDTGISPQLLKIADELVQIPMLGEIGSLNVSVATGVVLFEMLRQEKKSK